MFLLSLALIPVIVLLVFIYKKDKREKEPMGFLIGLFFLGMATTISATILELIGEAILSAIIAYPEELRAFLLAMLIVGPAEEFGKYTILRLRTWNSKHFDYSYDAIVYGVFISLGFAALENILYVFSSGIVGAILRMFTAVPGHACFGVFMGYFFSKAKQASVNGDKKKCKKYKKLAKLATFIPHGLYDAILMVANVSDNDATKIICFLLWLVFVIALFIITFICVNKSSKNDFCIVTLPGDIQTVYSPSAVGNWMCSCGSSNSLNFCPNCGKQRPLESAWACPQCGKVSAFNFCTNCGHQRPIDTANFNAIPTVQTQTTVTMSTPHPSSLPPT